MQRVIGIIYLLNNLELRILNGPLLVPNKHITRKLLCAFVCSCVCSCVGLLTVRVRESNIFNKTNVDWSLLYIAMIILLLTLDAKQE